MVRTLQDELKNFPVQKENAFERLQAIVNKKLQEFPTLKNRQRERISMELDVIEQTGTAGVFLFFYDCLSALKEIGAVFHGVMNCSYLCCVLGLTKVDPFIYKLPFERYFNTERKSLPFLSIVVPKNTKEQALCILQARNYIVKAIDRDDEYILSAQPVGEMPASEVYRANFYTFTLEEAQIRKVELFTEDEIYQKALERFGAHNFEGDEGYFGIKATENIFAETDGKFVYQEQFYTLCNRLLGVDNTTADLWRKSMCKRRKSECAPIRERFEIALGKAGAGLFDYLYDRMMFAVCKAYVIGLLFLDFFGE